MKDMRILSILKGDIVPQKKDIPLLAKVVGTKRDLYDSTELSVLEHHLNYLSAGPNALIHNYPADVLYGKDAKDFIDRMENVGSVPKESYERAKKVYDDITLKNITEAYDAITKHELKPQTIICTVCGNVYSHKDESTVLCQHLIEIFENFKRE